MTLVEFLLARIAEDEADIEAMVRGGDHGWWSPERMWRECEAKRRIVVDDEPGAGESDYYSGRDFQHRLTLAALVSVYVDHPDYDLAWAAG